MLGSNPCYGLASHPMGSRYTPSNFMLQKPGGITVALIGLLARMQTFIIYLFLCS